MIFLHFIKAVQYCSVCDDEIKKNVLGFVDLVASKILFNSGLHETQNRYIEKKQNQ